jgi:hypothetical protein
VITAAKFVQLSTCSAVKTSPDVRYSSIAKNVDLKGMLRTGQRNEFDDEEVAHFLRVLWEIMPYFCSATVLQIKIATGAISVWLCYCCQAVRYFMENVTVFAGS